MKHIKPEDVGKYFVDEQGEVWVCEYYCPHPSARLAKVKDREETVVSSDHSSVWEGFKRLRVVEE